MGIENFLKYLQYERRYSIHTVNSYRVDLEQFSVFCLSNFVENPVNASEKLIRQWIVELSEK